MDIMEIYLRSSDVTGDNKHPVSNVPNLSEISVSNNLMTSLLGYRVLTFVCFSHNGMDDDPPQPV